MKKVFLFDLDSTLLQMNQDEFLMGYFKEISKFVARLGYDPKEFMDIFNIAAYGIIKNDGSMSNEERFWTIMSTKYSNIIELKDLFESFYLNEFTVLEAHIHKTNEPKEIVSYLKSKGYKVILATNPVFPKISTYTRMSWAGLSPSLFDDVTTYEDSYYCKPNPKYFYDILKKHNLREEDCVMIGNDVDDDFSLLPSGIEKIIITDYLINKKNKEIDFPAYTMKDFLKYIKETY